MKIEIRFLSDVGGILFFSFGGVETARKEGLPERKWLELIAECEVGMNVFCDLKDTGQAGRPNFGWLLGCNGSA